MPTTQPYAEAEQRLQGFIERHLPPEQVQGLKDDVEAQLTRSGYSVDEVKKEVTVLLTEAGRLMRDGDPDSEAAKALVRRWKSVTEGVERPSPEVRAAWMKGMQEAMADPSLGPELPFTPEVVAFIRNVADAMKARGESG